MDFVAASFVALLFAIVTRYLIKQSQPTMKNSAFIFIKPHANTAASQELVRNVLNEQGITILKEGSFTGKEIDDNKLIDQHYYAIASKATLLKAEELAVPADNFEAAFGESWQDVLNQNRAFNAIDAKLELGVSGDEFNALWDATKKVKLGGGFYCGEISRSSNDQNLPNRNSIYTFNGFFMRMRSNFVHENSSIHFFVVEFEPEQLSWTDFRGKVLGPTDPSLAPSTSLRGKILASWRDLGLLSEPNVGDNCVHASASPFEGLVEKLNWLTINLEDDPFGSALLQSGISEYTIEKWGRDPQVNGKSLFDQLEDSDVDSCLAKMVSLNEVEGATLNK